jgi:NAD-dependent SIR2 family protein deacetylase
MAAADLEAAHAHSFENRVEIERSDLCGCFHCRKTFPPASIAEWTDDGLTALCPRCGIDSVIGAASGLPVHRSRFLGEMKRRWF